MVGFVGLAIVSISNPPKNDKDGINFTGEFYSGTKDTKIAKLNMLIFIVLRITSVIFVISFTDTISELKVGIFTSLHFGYLVYFISVKPFEEVRDNVIEIFLQTIFVIASIMLMGLDTWSDWKDAFEWIYITLIFFLPVILFFIYSFIIAKAIWKKSTAKPKVKAKKVVQIDQSLEVIKGSMTPTKRLPQKNSVSWIN